MSSSGTVLFHAQDLVLLPGGGFRIHSQKIAQSKPLNFSMAPGRLVGIVGRNGSGKSTLLKALAGLMMPVMGSLQYRGGDLASLSALERAQSLSWCPERIYIPFDYLVHEYLALGRYPQKSQRPWSVAKIVDFMEVLQVPHLAYRKTNELSSGELRKVVLLRTFITQTNTLLLDEPTAHLDLASCEQLFMHLKDLKKQGVSVVCVLHHLSLIKRFFDDVLVMDDFSIKASGPVSEVLALAEVEEVLGVQVGDF